MTLPALSVRFATVEFTDESGKRVRVRGNAIIRTFMPHPDTGLMCEVREPDLGAVRSRIIWLLGAIAHFVRGPLVWVSSTSTDPSGAGS